MKSKVDRELRRKKLSKNQLSSMVEFRDIEEHTKTFDLGEHISCKIRLQETVYPDKKPDVNVDIRKFLDNKYPFKGGKQGVSLPKERWLEFMQAAIDFTLSAFGPEVFYDEPEPQTQQEPVKKQPQISTEELHRMILAKKSVEDLNWGDLKKIAKK